MIIMDRTRRLRMNATLRDMVRENHVRVDELIYPVFVCLLYTSPSPRDA